MAILQTLGPVFIIIALGALLRWRGMVSQEVFGGIKKLIYWVGLPALLFVKVAAAGGVSGIGDSFWISGAGMAAAVVVALVVALILRMPSLKVGTFVQAGFRGNLAFIGLPVILFAFASADGADTGARAQQQAIITLALMIPIYNVLSVICLQASQHRFNGRAMLKMFVGILTNPLILACVAGVLWALWLPDMPGVMDRTLRALGQFTLPLALLCVGATLVSTPVRGNVRDASLATVVKIVVSPLAGWAVALLIGAGSVEAGIGLILCACPTAVASYVMADQMKGDKALAAGAIVLSTIASVASLGWAVWIIQNGG